MSARAPRERCPHAIQEAARSPARRSTRRWRQTGLLTGLNDGRRNRPSLLTKRIAPGTIGKNWSGATVPSSRDANPINRTNFGRNG